MYYPGVTEREKGIDAYWLADLRHFFSWALVNGMVKNTSGVLSTDERELCRQRKMILPRPLRAADMDHQRRVYDMDYWLCRIGANVDGDPAFGIWKREGSWNVVPRPAFIVNGVFDFFHGGHWDLLDKAIKLAETNDGYIYVLVESDDYVFRHKGHLPIFGEVTRSGWFKEYGRRVDEVIIWGHSKSWEEGYQLLGELMGRVNKQNVAFVLPDSRSVPSRREGESVRKRKMQIEGAGFSVVEVQGTMIDTSSSKISRKFNLQPTPEVLNKGW